MKKIIFLFILFISLKPFESNAQWIQSGGPLGGNIFSLAKSNNNKIWAGTADGLYFSLDNGASWQLNLPRRNMCIQVLASGDSIMVFYSEFIKAYNTVVFDSTNLYSIESIDNGSTWSAPSFIFSNGIIPLMGPLFNKVGNKYLSTSEMGYHPYVSTDFGSTWNSVTPSTALPNSCISEVVYNKETVFHSEANSCISPTVFYQAVSLDGENSWALIDSSMNPNKRIIGAADSTIFYLIDTLNPKIIRTQNLGVTFDTVCTLPSNYPKIPRYIRSLEDTLYVELIDTSLYYPTSKILRSKDHGLSWQIMGDNFNNVFWYGFGSKINNLVNLPNNEILYIDLPNLSKYYTQLDTSLHFINDIKASDIKNLKSIGNSLFAFANNSLNKSDDNGLTWNVVATSDRFNEFTYMDNEHDTIIVADGVDLRYSFDNGTSWNVHYHTGSQIYTNSVAAFLVNGTVLLDSGIVLSSTDFGLTWSPVAFVGGQPSGGNVNYVKKNDSLFYHFNDANSCLLYFYNSLTNQFELLGTSNLNSIINTPNKLTNAGGIWFNYGASSAWEYSIDGLAWQLSDVSSLPSPSVYPFYSKPVYCNGMHYAIYDDTTFVFSNDMGHSWHVFPGNNNVPFLKYFQSDVDVFLEPHKGVLYLATFQSSVWRRQDTLRNYTGNVYYDANSNGVKDANEINLKNILVYTPNSFSNTNLNGNFTLTTDLQGVSLQCVPPTSSLTSNPISHTISGTTLANCNFGLIGPSTISDFKIDLTNSTHFKPGFQTHIISKITNLGTLSQSSNIIIHLDSALSMISSFPSPISSIGNDYTYSISSLSFLQDSSIDLLVETSLSSNIGDSIHCVAQVTPLNSDINLSNNSCSIHQDIVGSYDPNDKTCMQGNYFTTTQLANGDALEFIIRFQNTGNQPTSFIRVEDTLSANLDWSTFQVLSSSHPVTYSLEGSGVVKFYFNPLSLPSQSQNEVESHGYIKYSIKPKHNVSIGSSISNTAYIYFDFNSPIITNTTNTIIVYPSILLADNNNLSFFELDDKIIIYPNPANSNFTIDLSHVNSNSNSNCLLQLYSLNGNKLIEQSIFDKLSKVSTNNLLNGTYFGLILNSKKEKIGYFKIEIQK